MKPAPRLIAVMGPTASGKSLVAETLADRTDAQLINADSFQIYRGMDIGTAKPRDKSRYRLIDIKCPNESFGVGEFALLAIKELESCYDRGQSAVLVGGTGQYVRALMEEFQDLHPAPRPELRAKLDAELADNGLVSMVETLRKLDPELAARTELMNPVRVRRAMEIALEPTEKIRIKLPPFTKEKIAIIAKPEVSAEKIGLRTLQMLQNGWASEVESLLHLGFKASDPGFRAIGYAAIAAAIESEGILSEEILAELATKIESETANYAKRQRTWLRSEPNLKVFGTTDEALSGTI
jgi:tRNA dimethylallyltransferase